MEEIEGHGIKIYPLPDCDSDEDEEYKEQVVCVCARVCVNFSKICLCIFIY